MLSHRRASASEVINRAKQVVALSTVASPANERLASQPHRSFATMNGSDNSLEAIFRQKHLLRSRIRNELKNMDPIRRSEEDAAIQSIVLNASWFKSSKSICAYISSPELREVDTSRIVSEILSKPANAQEGDVLIRRTLYVPRVEDRNSNMRMLRISSVDDLIVKSMNLLEPALSDADGNQHEDAMEAKDPADLFILPGLAFDRSGRRLGRSGGTTTSLQRIGNGRIPSVWHYHIQYRSWRKEPYLSLRMMFLWMLLYLQLVSFQLAQLLGRGMRERNGPYSTI